MSLQEHLTKIKDIRDQLEAIGWKMEEEDMVVYHRPMSTS